MPVYYSFSILSAYMMGAFMSAAEKRGVSRKVLQAVFFAFLGLTALWALPIAWQTVAMDRFLSVFPGKDWIDFWQRFIR